MIEKKVSKINYYILLKDFAIIIFSILLGVYSLINTSSIFFSILISLWLGFWIHALSLYIHEGAHGNLSENKKLNDLISNILSTVLLSINLSEYRTKHWKHHKHLGTIHDTENSYFNSLSFKNIIKFLTGLWSLTVITNSNNKKNEISINFYSKIIFLLIHGFFLLILLFENNYHLFLFYILSFFIFYPFFGIIRQILEHRNYLADNKVDYFKVDHGENNKIFGDSFFSKYFGAAGFNKHLLHHINPNISYTKFNDFEKNLNQNPKYKNILQENRTSYIKAFKNLFVF